MELATEFYLHIIFHDGGLKQALEFAERHPPMMPSLEAFYYKTWKDFYSHENS